MRSQDKTAAARIGVAPEVYVAERAAGKKWCSRCRTFKPAEEVRTRYCKGCYNQWEKERRAEISRKRRECDL